MFTAPGQEPVGTSDESRARYDDEATENPLTNHRRRSALGSLALPSMIATPATKARTRRQHRAAGSLREPLDALLGDPKEIEGHATTWHNLQERTYDAAEYFAGQVGTATSPWESSAIAAYRVKASQMADSTLALGEVADAMAEATLVAESIVGVFRNTVRDLIAEVVGAAVSKTMQVLLLVTIPKVRTEVAILVAKWTGKIVQVMRRLTGAMQALGGKFPALAETCTGSPGRWTARRRSWPMVPCSSTHRSCTPRTAMCRTAKAPGTATSTRTTARVQRFGPGRCGRIRHEGRVAVDALREGIKMNSIQHVSTTAGSRDVGERDKPFLDLPL